MGPELVVITPLNAELNPVAGPYVEPTLTPIEDAEVHLIEADLTMSSSLNAWVSEAYMVEREVSMTGDTLSQERIGVLTDIL